MLRSSLVLLLTVSVSLPIAVGETKSADIIVYGGTSAAITAAVQAKRMGHSVIVVSPDVHLGGLSSGGLGWTDTGNKAVIGGLAREFYGRLYDHYATDDAWEWQTRQSYGNQGQGTPAIDGNQRTMWIFEPHVAEAAFEAFVNENELQVDRNQWLDRDDGVVLNNGRIESIRTLDGTVYVGKVFIDTTYEGDLMAEAGVDYHVGRESTDTYDEKWNGVQTGVYHHQHHFKAVDAPVDPYVVPGDPSSGVIAKVSSDPPEKFGGADKKIQAYCFRMCLSNHPDNRVPFAKPKGYDPTDYELMARIYAAGWKQTLRKFDPIPNRKTDTNNHGPMSTDNIGANYDYPEASYARRREIIDQHEQYQRGWLFFLSTDPRVPEETRDQINQWGLAKDEFTDNDNWPHQIYVREARRMIGPVVMNENHLLKRIPTPKSVGMGSYAMDSHNVQRYIDEQGHVQNEGDIGVTTNGPYQISYGSLVPKKEQCENLLVPVCVSSSHIAFGSIRMEPVFMILGQSAATAANLAITNNTSVQDVDYQTLQTRLLQDGQVLETPPETLRQINEARAKRKQHSISIDSLKGIVIDDADATKTGAWQHSVSSSRYVGSGYHHDGDKRNGKASATFEATVEKAGRYEIRVAYPPNSNRTSRAEFTVEVDDLLIAKTVNQRKTPPLSPLMTSLGTFDFDDQQQVTVSVTNANSDGYVIIDAVQIVPASETPTE